MKKVMYLFIVATVFMGSTGIVFLNNANARGDSDGKGYLHHNRDSCPINSKTPCSHK